MGERFGAGRLDRQQPSASTATRMFDHLPIAVVGPGQLAPYALHGGRQHPGLEGSAIAESARLTGKHRDVMPGIVDRRAAAKGARMRDDACYLLDRAGRRVPVGAPQLARADRRGKWLVRQQLRFG